MEGVRGLYRSRSGGYGGMFRCVPGSCERCAQTGKATEFTLQRELEYGEGDPATPAL